MWGWPEMVQALAALGPAFPTLVGVTDPALTGGVRHLEAAMSTEIIYKGEFDNEEYELTVKPDGTHWVVGAESGVEEELLPVLSALGLSTKGSKIAGYSWVTVNDEYHLCGVTRLAVITEKDGKFVFNNTEYSSLEEAKALAEELVWDTYQLSEPRILRLELSLSNSMDGEYSGFVRLPSKYGDLLLHAPDSNLESIVPTMLFRLADLLLNKLELTHEDGTVTGDPVKVGIDDLTWLLESELKKAVAKSAEEAEVALSETIQGEEECPLQD